EMADRIRELGGEYGSTTGRPRRCGWLDLEALRYAHGLNGFACLALTKLDVLTGVPDLKICVGYQNPDGSPCTYETAGPDVQPVLESLSGWTEDISGIRQVEDLPTAARRFIARVEEVSGVPVGMVGVGPGRAQSILVEDAWPGPR
ncbi:MAG: adenylosuccinate synthetase, partial [Myxococcota bacterium]|nr:adenylosuccinate synthetase [Myxococcota bacterium]